jgi:HPt (histidine-containing phosphotransfer) domain-containing protein
MAQIEDAILRGDASRLKGPAHALKGSVGLFAVQDVVELAQTLECLGQAGELMGATEAYRSLETEMKKLKSALAELLSPMPGPAAGP